MYGELVDVGAPVGSKAEGSSRLVLRSDDGVEYNVVAEALPTVRGRHRVRGRMLVPDMSYVARTNGPDLWLVRVVEAGEVVRETPPTKPCP